MYKLIFSDGRELKVNSTHINPFFLKEIKNKQTDYITWTTEFLYNNKDAFIGKEKDYRVYTWINEPIEFSKKELILDPYLVGLALGDGYMEYGKGLRIKCLYDEAKFFYDELKNKYDISTTVQYEKSRTKMLKLSVHNINNELKELKLAGVTGSDKFIPEIYMFGSIEQRKRLLAGLFDTDGSARGTDAGADFSNISKKLVEQISELARGLGYKVGKISENIRGGNRKPLYTIRITSHNKNPFMLTIKKDKYKYQSTRKYFTEAY